MDQEQDGTFCVVINDEEQYSLWPDFLDLPEGWREAGCRGTRGECLDFVEKHWTDMRPKSLREKMAQEGLV
jgi:uncharacterized protein YbdZ (MbtH family)